MTAFDLISKKDLQNFKEERFAGLRRPGYKLNKKDEQKEWIKTFDVQKLLDISQDILISLRRNGTIRFSKVGETFYYKPDDILKLLEG